MAVVDQIFIASGARLPMQPLQTVIVTATGLDGDRYAIRKGSFSGQRHDLRDVTLISLDDIHESNSMLSVPFSTGETRRNIVIAGSISLHDFIGREFAIGSVKLRGIEEAAPCRHPEKVAKKSGFLRAFKGRAGIRAKVVEVGRISVGDEVRLLHTDNPAMRLPRGDEAILDRLEQLFITRGKELYLGEPVTIAEHMLQCAALAQAQVAPDALIAAALLHDIGHFALEEDIGSSAVDWKHEEGGAALLEGHFPPVVVASVRLHVAAKRYLCATDDSYFGKLSDASKHSLALQGGPMSASEKAQFEALPYHREAIRVRLWDDWGKEQGLRTPSFGDFRRLLQRVLQESVRPLR